ncbi:MAG: PIN domain-containing protein [Clostridiales bacterium]|jgi:predicted nucleic acid-binding protein|nr:PIN domain-containing protein [Clostridiales bacterium]
MRKYAIDSNVIIEIVNGNENSRARLNDILDRKDEIVIPPIVFYEVMCGFYHNPSKKKEAVFFGLRKRQLIGQFYDFSGDLLWDKAARIFAELKRKGKGHAIGHGDILLASYCMVNNLILITKNTKHFKYIDGLALEDWMG